ncbi:MULTISPECIES: hypothetical protein [unclassified Ruminococcus]|uniref:hypothetical protein n=1 Tax=unclassified Ruminococcus TaxID=2608920 RepID=UPI00210D5EBE|nr:MULTISPECIES: hypothetical protein [unclassified Ruminococcus]MCQ4021511.1 hypothetical protein [Ruminococcus sp. zg-924]MCQ4113956.1 hypothetical protein [Ruminococcus sp. zg-921]
MKSRLNRLFIGYKVKTNPLCVWRKIKFKEDSLMKKTQKSFRKKALLSSLSMLLVATVAVGSATFAWFTSSTQATASNINVQTTKSSELVVSKSDLVWGDTVDYLKPNAVLRPISSADGSNWYKANAAAKTASTAKAGTYAQVTGAALNDYLIDDMLNIKNNGGSACSNVTITITSESTSKFYRLALVPVDDQTTAGTKPAVTEANFKANIYGAAADDTWKPYKGTAVTTDNYSIKAAANGATVIIPSLAANEVASYRVLVWFEGEDSDCYDTTTSSLTAPSISFKVTGTSGSTT